MEQDPRRATRRLNPRDLGLDAGEVRNPLPFLGPGLTTRDILRPRVDSERRSNLSGYLSVFIFAALILAFGVVSLAAAWLLRPSRPDIVKLMNYECGAEPIGSAWVQFPVGFYLVALVFIVFDALAVFLFPWALILETAGMAAFWVMVAFIGTISLGWVYAYREGVLEWK
jgi:NADH-quinone oxidoreductase subunit A